MNLRNKTTKKQNKNKKKHMKRREGVLRYNVSKYVCERLVSALHFKIYCCRHFTICCGTFRDSITAFMAYVTYICNAMLC